MSKRQRSLVNFCQGSSGSAGQKRSREDRSTSSGASMGSSSSMELTSDSEQPAECQEHDLGDDAPVSFFLLTFSRQF